jgi:hypothetical protein
MKLISMTDYVLEQPFSKDLKLNGLRCFYKKIENYANFLKQPLKLGMFVPTDENGNVWEEPKQEHYTDCNEEQNAKDWIYNLEKFNKAKENVLFEGFEITTPSDKCHIIFCKENIECQFLLNSDFSFNIRAFQPIEIEDLVKYNLTITETAIKKLNL